MIFVAVGTQLPFDRMVRTIDDWAGSHGQSDVFGQIGPSTYKPRHMEWREFIAAPEFRRRVAEAEVVIAHAGMGSIITALELGKPILVMPRRAALGEHRNDHQVATARQFLAQGRIQVAFDEQELLRRLNTLHDLKSSPVNGLGTTASPRLIAALRSVIHAGESDRSR
jgi:UDP-N-acetylglucosamine transferase subunit ALG13